jgi:hypothetical protein
VTAEGQPHERACTEDGKFNDFNRMLAGISQIQSASCDFGLLLSFLLDKISRNRTSW